MLRSVTNVFWDLKGPIQLLKNSLPKLSHYLSRNSFFHKKSFFFRIPNLRALITPLIFPFFICIFHLRHCPIKAGVPGVLASQPLVGSSSASDQSAPQTQCPLSLSQTIQTSSNSPQSPSFSHDPHRS